MNKLWPFNFFPSMKDNDTSIKEELADVEVDVAETETSMAEENPVAEEMPLDDADAATVETVDVEEELIDEEVPADEISEDDEEENLPDLEEELEIALAKAHEEQAKKDRERTKVVAGLAILGAIGLATGFGIRSYIKKRKN